MEDKNGWWCGFLPAGDKPFEDQLTITVFVARGRIVCGSIVREGMISHTVALAPEWVGRPFSEIVPRFIGTTWERLPDQEIP